MCPYIVFIDNVDENGKISISKEDLKELITNSYNEGYYKGLNEKSTYAPYTGPYYKINTPFNPYEVTCEAHND